MSPSRRLLRYMLKYRRAFAIGFACVIVTAAVGLTGPWVLKYAIDDLGQGVDTGKIAFYAWLLPLRHAADHHRGVARHRIRPP
jgi:ATP-binding cassette subfamily B protein